jgi:hypothetical protein
MKIVAIFALEKESLYTVQYENEQMHEWDRLFDNWTDAEYLYNFFEEHETDLTAGFWGNISIEDAVLRTIEDARKLRQFVFLLAQKGKNDLKESLQTHFKPLNKNCYDYQKPLLSSKAYGLRNKSWLRLYALRIDANVFVICGGAIKLTENMNFRNHLLNELEKMEITKKFLQQQELTHDYNFDFLELIV